MLTFTITPGAAKTFPVRCRSWSKTGVPYGSTDTLSAQALQGASATPVCTPAAAWYTAPDAAGNPTQTGYDQGEVATTLTKAQSATLAPGLATTVLVWRTQASDPSDPELIARFRLIVTEPYLS